MSPANLAHSAGSPPSSSQAFGLRELGLTLELLHFQKVGFGAVGWLRLGPVAPGLLTISRGGRESARTLRIGETGQVPEIQVENRGREPLLLPAHLVLSGGWQTRAVERSVVVPGGGSARVPVKCVEAGRWAPRDEQTARSFAVADRTGVRTRWSTSRNMAEQLARNGRYAAEQSRVWQQIDEELTRSAVASRTRSYEAYLHDVKQRLLAEAQKAAVRPPLAANGMAIFPRGGGFWIEAYPGADALAEHADDLLSDLFDPGHVELQGPGARAPAPAETTPADVDRLLEAISAAPLRRLEPVADTGGDAYTLRAAITSGGDAGPAGPASGADGAVLLLDGGLAHLAIGAAPAGREDGASGDRHSGHGDLPAPSTQPQRPVSVRGPSLVDPVIRAPAVDAASAPGAPAASPLPSSPAVNHANLATPSHTTPRSVPVGTPWPPVAAAQGSDGGNEHPRVDLETMRGIFARARDLAPEGPPAVGRVQGYRLVRVLDRNISWVDIRISGDGYAVLGSHDRCDLVLSSDAGVWLRHLAAICVRLEDDSVGLRLIDLKTDLPFFLDDDTPRWSVLARGPFAMRLGRHVVCGFPIGAAATDNARVDGAGPRAPSPDARGDARGKDIHATGVLETGMSFGGAVAVLSAASPPAVNELTTFLPGVPVSQIQDLLGPNAASDRIRVTLERGGMGASVELPAAALEAGVLLGRALNCFDGGLRRIFCEAISRAHVLLVQDRGEIFAFDLCSTNGTRVGGQRIRRHRLDEAGATLELGKKVIFRWHRRE